LGPSKQSIKTRSSGPARKEEQNNTRGAVGNPRRGFSKDSFWFLKDIRNTGTLQEPPSSPQGSPVLHRDHKDHPEHQRVPEPINAPKEPLVSSINVVIRAISAVIPPKVPPFGWVVPGAPIKPCSSAPGPAVGCSRGTVGPSCFGFLLEPNLVPFQSQGVPELVCCCLGCFVSV